MTKDEREQVSEAVQATLAEVATEGALLAYEKAHKLTLKGVVDAELEYLKQRAEVMRAIAQVMRAALLQEKPASPLGDGDAIATNLETFRQHFRQ